MIAHRIRKLLFGNWRTKGVALFFAVTIWVVAYQAQTQTETITVRLVPEARPEGAVIIRQEFLDLTGVKRPFDGDVHLTVTGPRKQIEKLRAESVPELKFPIEMGPEPSGEAKPVPITAAAFSFLPPGVEFNNVFPDNLVVAFDQEAEKELQVEPRYGRLPEGMEPEPARIEPKFVKLRGPQSVLDRIQVVAEAPWLGAERFEDDLPVTKVYPEALDRKMVESKVRFVGPSRVRLSVRLRYKSDFFDADGVRIRFLVPSVRFPFRIQFDEETVKARFQGPVGEIRKLRERVKDTDFALAVRVPAPAADGERTITFTEDGLLLYGFSERIQILQHPDRQSQGKGAWTFTLTPAAPASKPSG